MKLFHRSPSLFPEAKASFIKWARIKIALWSNCWLIHFDIMQIILRNQIINLSYIMQKTKKNNVFFKRNSLDMYCFVEIATMKKLFQWFHLDCNKFDLIHLNIWCPSVLNAMEMIVCSLGRIRTSKDSWMSKDIKRTSKNSYCYVLYSYTSIGLYKIGGASVFICKSIT